MTTTTAHVPHRAVISHLGAGDDQFARCLTGLASQMPDVEFVVVADTADAVPLALQIQSQIPNVRHLQLHASLGKGAGLRAGFNATAAEYVCFLSSGGDVRASDVARAFDELEGTQADVVVGSRVVSGAAYDATPFRRALSIVLNVLGRLLFGLTVADSQSPVKAFRRDAVVAIFEDLRLYNHGFDIEVVYQAQRAGLTIREIPISWRSFGITRAFVAQGLHAALAVLLLRIYNSALARIPLLDIVGRHYHIPTKRHYNIMIFCWRDPLNPLAGGGEVYLHEQARQWVAQGHGVTWFAQRFSGSCRAEDVDGISVVRYGRFPLLFALAPLWYVFRSGRRFDFIIDCINGIPFFTPLYSLKPKAALVYHVHSHHFNAELPRALAWLASFVETKLVPVIYRRTPFITISDSTRDELESLAMTRMPIELIHSGVATDLVPGVKSQIPTILYLGRLKRYKGVRKLIDAFAKAKRVVADARLVIAGSGDDEASLQQYVRERKLDDVLFVGRVDEATKVQLMQEAWVFGMPSTIEGWGIVVIEANSCGTPAVAYNVNGLRDCIRNGETGYLCDDDESFADALLTLLLDAQRRAVISCNAYAWSRQFSWHATAQQTLQTIRAAQPWKAVFEPVGAAAWELHYRSTAMRR